MRIRILRNPACLGALAALSLSPLTTGLASAATMAAEPAPACLVLNQSWRYAQAGNGCGVATAVKIVYQDGAEGACIVVRPDETPTIGEGYLGHHGRALYLALCQ
ncbi:hypothetical protein ABIE67_000505 [Streptomyces sp. V4I8]|uniref:hypothetical protein n=1 Tax=Streptomyces sp. V4I8 TaxID=3156469 RepID=UPI0035112E48